MTLHWGQTQAMSIGTSDCIVPPGGTDIQSQSSLHYLGAVISSDGKLDSEVTRQIGTAKADFHQLAKLWSHANVPTKDKLKFFHAFVATKLQYDFLVCGLLLPSVDVWTASTPAYAFSPPTSLVYRMHVYSSLLQ